MKKIFSIITLIAVIFSCNFSVFAQKNERALDINTLSEKNYVENLVNELKEIDFNNKEKVEKTLANFHQSNKLISGYKNRLSAIKGSKSLEKREYMLDEKNKVVFDSINDFGIMTIITEDDENKGYTKNIGRSRRSGAIYSAKGTKKFSSYGILGNTLFTIKIKYKFRAANDEVEVKEGKGWCTPGFLSVWSGSIWTDKNSGTSSEAANVNSYGTASWSVPLSKLLGVPANIQSVDYDAYVYYDIDGNLSHDIDYEKTGL